MCVKSFIFKIKTKINFINVMLNIFESIFAVTLSHYSYQYKIKQLTADTQRGDVSSMRGSLPGPPLSELQASLILRY